MTSAAETAARLDQATAPHRLLDHPFYRAWADGSLTLADLRDYSAQYWRQVEAFPDYLGSLVEALPDQRTRSVVEDNLRDEVDGDHSGLWLKFASAVGIEAQEVKNTPIEPETAACVAAFSAATQRSPEYALGMIYGYESQTPAVAHTKVAGLKEHYGIDGDGVDYFELHGEMDVEHSRDLAAAIAIATEDGSLAEAEAGAAAGAAAVWQLLDGVERIRNSSAN